MANKQTKTEAATPEAGREYTVVARRYRPQQFADLIGQESVAKALTNAIQSNRVAHAYLFTGVRGVGKTSTARILAKALNCEKGPTPTPCGQCDICLAIADGQDVDVQEINGADNRGIDEVRAIRNNVATRPQRARYKIYIIDEVHMLTPPAFNALLKTLEEPPAHVKFIFATTDVQKIPLTILSRCQRFDLPGINTARIFEQLKGIVAREGLAADDDGLRIIARRAGGSMRDAQSLLEQLLSFGGERLTAGLIHSMLGTAADDRVVDLASAVLAKDAKGALGLVSKCADEGLQLGELIDQMIGYWRGLMLVNCSEAAVEDLDVADHHRDTVKQQARGMTLDTILAGLDVLTTTKTRLRATNHGQVLLEMTVVRLSRLDELVPVAQLAQWLSQPGAARPVTQTPPSAEPSKKNGMTGLGEAFRAGTNGHATPQAANANPIPIDDANLSLIWDKVKLDAGAMLAGQLARAGIPAIVGPKTLALRFASVYNHEHEYCKEPSRTRHVEGLLKKVTGQEWSLRFELTANAPVVAPTAPVLSNRERERRAMETPLLSRIVAGLEGRLLKMDEGFGEASGTP